MPLNKKDRKNAAAACRRWPVGRNGYHLFCKDFSVPDSDYRGDYIETVAILKLHTEAAKFA